MLRFETFFWLKVVRRCPNFHKLRSGALKYEKFRWNDAKRLKGTNLKITPGIEMVIPIIIFPLYFLRKKDFK